MAILTEEKRFTPWCMCPSCGRLDLHSLHIPDPFDPADPTHVALEHIHMAGWIGGLGLDRMAPSDAARYEVVRTCRCGHEWGQEPIVLVGRSKP